MNASYEWLKAFIPFDLTPAQLRDLITSHTATVDELVPVRQDLEPIVIAKVMEASPHPDSDHLWFTKVDDGSGDLLEVVCGAPNVTVGKLYPFARVGVTIPTGMKMERRKIRGIVSNGMLCSAKELNLGIDGDGILELNIDAKPGTKFLSAMTVGDTRIVIDVGANRSDLHSHLGLARELSAVLGVPYQLPEIPGMPKPVFLPMTGEGGLAPVTTKIRVDADTKTREYGGGIIRGVKVGPSPDWLKQRIEAVGGRSINNVVDATNYILHELGQPVHAFDLAKLQGTIVVRKAKAGEKITTLDGVERTLKTHNIVIADDRGAQAIAGVIGGKDSEVTDATTDLFVEVASFDPQLTRISRKGLGISTDASYRFERGVDPSPIAMLEARDRAVRIIMAVAGGSVDGPDLVIPGEFQLPHEITLRAARVKQVLGDEISTDECERILKAAGFYNVTATDIIVTAVAPSWRTDILTEVDLIEEIARFHGYANFSDEIRPYRPTTTHDDPMWTTARRIRDAMVGLGYLEARPMPFVKGADDTHASVANPLSAEEGFLRTSILETLARRAEYNLAQRIGDVRLFEVGSVFNRSGQAMPHEHVHLGIVLMGQRRPPHFGEPQPPKLDEWDAKAVAEAAVRAAFPGESITLVAGGEKRLWELRDQGKVVGWITRLALDAPVWAAPAYGIEIILGRMVTEPPAAHGRHNYMEVGAPKAAHLAKYRAIPTMPPAEFDLALLVPTGTTVAQVEANIRESAGELLESLVLFDQYTGAGVPAGHRSLAWRLTFRDRERTLRDKEIEGRRTKIMRSLEDELNVRQRST
jgi:phenylalanyl-tRNA synthetase beta chain